MKNIILTTKEDNCMSLSCWGQMTIQDGIITYINYKGMPRVNGDYWYRLYEIKKIGDTMSENEINNILGYNGKYNVISWIKEDK